MVVAVEMGYGHLRAAHTLAEAFGTEVLRMDAPPLARPSETVLWQAAVRLYNALSQACDWPVAGPAARLILESITRIAPLRPDGAKEPAGLLTRLLDCLTRTVIGRHFRAVAASAERPILATYPAIAMAARQVPGVRVFCLVTDTDLNRSWAPADAAQASIDYLAPSKQVAQRLRSFGVPDQRIHVTGFPLPARLVRQTQPALARRLHRLDPKSAFRAQAPEGIGAFLRNNAPPSLMRPIALTMAIGGAGAQTRQVGQILQSLRGQILSGKLSLTLVAGKRHDVAGVLRKMVQSAGLAACIEGGIKILLADDTSKYFQLFEDCLAETDLLWTKPSELVFYAALGLPLLLAPPVGGQEHANREWLLSHGSAVDAGKPAVLDRRLEDLLATGELCRIAWNAYSRLDRNGCERILELVGGA
jgi:hypothetical protein